ncbi:MULTISPECIES: hypothetical protein [unclassified Clostridioides]|uniref:hypothetical protein n=1 Tax=unclassified Clostridioides TaxID=2635829 RepID=UPI001D11306A|nr:hypothetical protein [Clostridioides sp. ZZV14-6150]MCC0667531.1 hypothetical protein [Clostridioides sp. ZZV14-6153]MCC0720856.1 hypothetical protein [Clostridioides sp. ZZV14-6104]MCC0728566.1 hypothetical protein [Clostridioides sp. ZZV14-6045]MCC0731132.1 hypothetical protein [Clostridioides sp. ZZV14-6048]MCC0733434.1 hypothetical protein [Clostridioides sp. ZZV14-6009]MCC0741335.1 hypothetical protein [Clostridioides sp. ZZV14-6044]MCC0749516.1 hypothetical protein [Clostridioides s
MLKKWFGIMKKRQKVEEAKEEGEIILKNEKILYEENLIDNEKKVLYCKEEVISKENESLNQEEHLSDKEDEVLSKEVVYDNKNKVLSKEELIINNDKEELIVNDDDITLNKVEIETDDTEIAEKSINSEEILINKNTTELDKKEVFITEEFIKLNKKEILLESKKTDSKELEEIDQSENNILVTDTIEVEEKQVSDTNEYLTKEDLNYIKEIKIRRGRSIKAINLYTKEEKIFDTHIQCSKNLKVPLGYIRENLKYGYMDYFGEAINYLSKVLKVEEYCKNEWSYLENSKSPSEIFNILNDKIFSTRLSDKKRNEILTNDKIETIKMNYKFECIDEEYDEYFKKYKSIIKRGGKKKIELVNKKGEVLEIFKSLEECSIYLQKEKNEVIQMLKYGDTKIGRNFIRYSLRNI